MTDNIEKEYSHLKIGAKKKPAGLQRFISNEAYDKGIIDSSLLINIFENSISGILVQTAVRNSEGKITDFKTIMMNPAAEEITGFNKKDILDEKIRDKFPGMKNDGLFDKYIAVMETGVPQVFVHRFKNEAVDIHAVVHLAKHENCIIKNFFDITRRYKAEKEVENINKDLKLLAEHLQYVERIERRKISRELHDKLAQIISVLGMNLDYLNKNAAEASASPFKTEFLREAAGMKSLLNDASDAVRDILSHLRVDVTLKKGLNAALRKTAADFEKDTGIKTQLITEKKNPVIGERASLAVFRIIQEALSNIKRHSGADKALIEFNDDGDSYSFRIKDNGKGFNIKNGIQKMSYGLIVMKERAIIAGADIDISSAEGGGTCVHVVIPK